MVQESMLFKDVIIFFSSGVLCVCVCGGGGLS